MGLSATAKLRSYLPNGVLNPYKVKVKLGKEKVAQHSTASISNKAG